ncbi:hypothetical protein Daus18300_000031 [Diaporthe australafricana]|uniref:Uncharacterized protein n=1 Tax=Diaporthe australafricana TaxID=127596 RepID=A0ABR3Y794_9PEZI
MATEQDGNMPPLGEQLEPPVLNSIEAFKPLVPKDGMASTSQRLQHIYVTNGSPSSFGHVVSKQWRSDSAIGRNTWAVLGTEDEVAILLADLINGDITDVPGQAMDVESMVAPAPTEALSGLGTCRLVFVTFKHLVRVLSECFLKGPTWGWDAMFGSPTVVMNFASGDMTFEMAFACPLLARLIEDTIGTSLQTIMACTVSNDNMPYFGKEWRDVQMQEITVLTRAPRPAMEFMHYAVDQSESPEEMKEAVSNSRRKNSRNGVKKRSLLVAGNPLLSEVSWTSKDPKPIFARELHVLRQDATRDLVIDDKMAHFGCVSNVGDVIIQPFTAGCTFDRLQLTWGAGEHCLPRSQVEINYHSQHCQESAAQPNILVLASKEQFDSLPAHCETSIAHGAELARLLICCKLIWPGVPIANIPVLLPENENFTMHQLRFLSVKRLVVRPLKDIPGEATRPGKREMPHLYMTMTMTKLGHTTATILMHGVQSLHSAHLLGQLLDPTGGVDGLSYMNVGIVDAILALAVLTETRDDGETQLKAVISMRKPQPSSRDWYEGLRGVGAGQAGRGPMWLAVGIWQKLMTDHSLRGPLEYCGRRPPEKCVAVNHGCIDLFNFATLHWDRRLVVMNSICASLYGISPAGLLSTTTLGDQELLAVEVALVRAFMERIICVVKYGEEFEARDMASGCVVGRPFRSQEAQIWWEDCVRRDTLPNGRKPPVTFWVYSHLIYSGSDYDDGGVIRIPQDLAHVSFRAYRLAHEGTSLFWRVQSALDHVRSMMERHARGADGTWVL